MDKRKLKKITLLFVILVFMSLIIISSMTCCSESDKISNLESETAEQLEQNKELPQVEESIASTEGETDDTEQQQENIEADNEDINTQIDQKDLENDLLRQLQDFIKAINMDTEYSFFDSYTKKMLGSELEYLKDENDTYVYLRDNYSNLSNIKIEKIRLFKNRASANIVCERIANNTKNKNLNLNFQFIYEQGVWKIDFYYNPSITVTPINPLPEVMLSYPNDREILIRYRVESFFPISEIVLRLNKKKLEPTYTGDNFTKYSYITIPFPQEEVPYIYDLVLVKNDIVVFVTDVFGESIQYDWIFYVESIAT